MSLTYHDAIPSLSATGARDEAIDRLARLLHETRESIAAHGGPVVWDELREGERAGYRCCVEELLAEPDLIYSALGRPTNPSLPATGRRDDVVTDDEMIDAGTTVLLDSGLLEYPSRADRFVVKDIIETALAARRSP